MLNIFGCDRKVIKMLVESNGEDFRYITKVDISESKITVHFKKDNRKSSLDYTADRLAETYFNEELSRNPEFSARIKSNSVVYKDFKRKLDEELALMKDQGKIPEYDTLFETTLAVLLEGQLPFGQTDAGLKMQKNENVGRNKKKTAEKKAEAEAENEKKLPKAEDIEAVDTIKTEDVETPGETKQEDKGGSDDREEKITVPKNFRRTNVQLARGLSAEEAYKEKLAADSDALLAGKNKDENDLGFLADA